MCVIVQVEAIFVTLTQTGKIKIRFTIKQIDNFVGRARIQNFIKMLQLKIKIHTYLHE